MSWSLRSLLEGYREGWRRYTDFTGRSTVGEYVAFLVVNLLVGLLLHLLESITEDGLFGFVGGVYALAALLPGIAVTVRVLRTWLRPRP
ncbi:DUF805 domain-containing protein [Neolewinella litorea]|uniref:DUF805 domain-containing protein n=1 Tax=Neolewinella litorea TaxID=2562452 RepID=A0A4S4NN74_9BACT|nr:DUF805 domain-containing protein [Neolewinella litorea]THH39818.1 DUF805 domain-containing protein [Neolewinella litorea]